LPNPVQLPFHRAIVNSAAHSNHCATQDGLIPRVARPHLFPGEFFHAGLERTSFCIAEFSGAGNLRLRESQALIQFLFKLLTIGPRKLVRR